MSSQNALNKRGGPGGQLAANSGGQPQYHGPGAPGRLAKSTESSSLLLVVLLVPFLVQST
eukprot:585131-Hanusia_phi.AAC.1